MKVQSRWGLWSALRENVQLTDCGSLQIDTLCWPGCCDRSILLFLLVRGLSGSVSMEFVDTFRPSGSPCPGSSHHGSRVHCHCAQIAWTACPVRPRCQPWSVSGAAAWWQCSWLRARVGSVGSGRLAVCYGASQSGPNGGGERVGQAATARASR